LKAIEETGVSLVGISYDEPDTLKRFVTRRKIGFPLLSDPDSKTITAYGLLNEEAKGKGEGIPHPLTVIIDKDGVIRGKLGFDGYRQRHASEDLITAIKEMNNP